jgi:arsenical pump membrane protein
VFNSNFATWGIAALATAGVILRPLKVPEAVWAVSGAVLLVLFGLLPLRSALAGIGRGADVYFFLTGMMLLAELARETGLFDWLAAQAASHAHGSATRLFGLVYLVGIVVTVFLSNDATAVVLTPAVAAVTRASKVANPLPYLLICAFIANAASFALPISNPANLVIYASRMPPLSQWLPLFALPSVVAIGTTFIILRYSQRGALRQALPCEIPVEKLSTEGRASAWGIAATVGVLMLASARGWQLGVPTCLAGVATLLAVSLLRRSLPWTSLREMSWGILPLVAGLFILVEALDNSGAIRSLAGVLRLLMQRSVDLTAVGAGMVVGFASNIMNNLPAGLVAGTAVQAAGAPTSISSAILIGVDVGPNLSVTGSLATILWLSALRREGIQVGAVDFLKLGLLIMPPTLLLSLCALLLVGQT